MELCNVASFDGFLYDFGILIVASMAVGMGAMLGWFFTGYLLPERKKR